eukprot:4898682-Amphidinium_carterae.2
MSLRDISTPCPRHYEKAAHIVANISHKVTAIPNQGLSISGRVVDNQGRSFAQMVHKVTLH